MEMPEAAAANAPEQAIKAPANPFDNARPDLDQMPFVGMRYSNGACVVIAPRWLRELGHGPATELLFGLVDDGHLEIVPPEFADDGALLLEFRVLPGFFMPENEHRFTVPDHLLLHFPVDDFAHS